MTGGMFRFVLLASVLLVPLLVRVDAQQWMPVVLMHGISSNASDMAPVVEWIEADFPGIYVRNVEIGDGYWDSITLPVSTMVDMFADEVRNDPKLADGFNLIGYSQGGLVTRGYVERYFSPPVHNFITWSSPHGGEYGIPHGTNASLDNITTNMFDQMFAGAWTEQFIQEHVSFASYWRDPDDLADYLKICSFLPDINCEGDVKNSSYKENILKLNSLTLLYSTVDNVIIPKESGWFYTFADNDNSTVVPLQDRPLYTDDWIGLRTLDETGRLFLNATDCPHGDYPTASCKKWYDLYTRPLLNVTFSRGGYP